MIFSRRLRGKRLADLCHRLAISDESGIDVRRSWAREAENARGSTKETFALVRDGVNQGDPLADSIRSTDRFFPTLFVEMVEVGEKSGGLSTVYHRLSSHYQRGHERARAFRARLAWPLFQLVTALGVVGLMLLIFSVLEPQDLRGRPIDLLGLGAGMTGVTNYVLILVTAALAISLLIVSMRREAAWTRPAQAMLLRAPGVGSCLEKIALARITWVLHLTLNVEMDLRRLVPLAMRAAGNDHYARRGPLIVQQIERGRTLHQAFASAGCFPPQFLDALQVAEESGQLVESMGRLSKQYDDEAESAMQTLGALLSFAIWGGVAMLIIVMIFKLFSFYAGVLNDAANL